MATNFKGRVISDSLVDAGAPSGPQPVWTQWIPEDMCSNQVFVLLERHEGEILQYCKSCKVYALQKVQKMQFEKQIFEPGVQPMDFVSMDLIGEFHPPSSKGNRYALTSVCMLT